MKGAKLTRLGHLCINVWGDAAIGFTGMDFETLKRGIEATRRGQTALLEFITDKEISISRE